MTTQEFISLCLEEFGSALTRQRAMEYTNWAQNEILGDNNEVMRVKPDPFFATSDGVYSYAASSYMYDSSDGTQGDLVGDIRNVTSIYSYDNSASIFDNQTLDPASEKPNQFELRPTTDKVVQVQSVIQSVRPSNSDCTIKLWESNNPGDTTVVWRAACYKWPAQIVSESIALTLPWDFHDTLLLWAVAKRVRRKEYGTNPAAFDMYEKYLKSFRSKYGSPVSQEDNIMLPRDF